MNFDLGSFFFFIIITELLSNLAVSLFTFNLISLVRQINPLQMSPLILYLYLKPLYSIRGGSTILAELFIKNPSEVDFLLKPLYRWNTFTHLTFVLSET